MTRIRCVVTECIHNTRHKSNNPDITGLCRKKEIGLAKLVSGLEVSHNMGPKVYHICTSIEMEK